MSLQHLRQTEKNQTTMDPKVWCQLPEDLLDRIVARLPLPTIVRLRSVCKRWNSFLVSDNFFTLHYSRGTRFPCPSFFFWKQRCTASIYVIPLHRWYSLPMPTQNLVDFRRISSAAGSLLVFARQHSQVVLVYNPFTRKMRDLPPTADTIHYIHKLSINCSSDHHHSYKILAAGMHAEALIPMASTYNYSTQVYDSISDSWKLAENTPPLNFSLDPAGVWCGGFFFCVATRNDRNLVGSFDLSSLSWSTVEVPDAIAGSFYSVSVVECMGKLLLVGGIYPDHDHRNISAEGINIWELQMSGDGDKREWVQFHRMPEDVWGEFKQQMDCYDHKHVFSMAMENLICLTSYGSTSSRSLLLNASTHTWTWLPEGPASCTSDFQTMKCALEARLDIDP